MGFQLSDCVFVFASREIRSGIVERPLSLFLKDRARFLERWRVKLFRRDSGYDGEKSNVRDILLLLKAF